MSVLASWLQHAPKPWPLKEGQKWHVFLSYRSAHRRWVIQLYDIMRQLGYEVFLDQYVLNPSDNLVFKLSEAFSKSAAAVLIWSKAAADTAWCKNEYASMIAREKVDHDFHFVVANLEQGDLPSFAAVRSYQDFSDHREGPSGANLLRLLNGLRNQPLPQETVKFADAVDEDFKESIHAIKAAQYIGDAEELLRLSQSTSSAWTFSALLPCQAAEALVNLGRNDDALTILTRAEGAFPKSIRPKQLKGLAYRRKRDWRAAQNILAKLTAAGEMDPETLGIFAATWLDRYKEEGNELYLRKSRDLYAQAFLNAPRDYYVGINAAAKSVLLGELEEGKKYAEQVEQIVGDKVKPNDFWMTATVAEVQLIEGQYAKAADLYQAAVVIEPDSLGSHSSIWDQAQLLMDKLQTPAGDRARIAAVFKHLAPKTTVSP
jgi:hypothetical protein